MSKTYFIADTHFGDGFIIGYENRPFDNAQEMDNIMIGNWNMVVQDDDIIYVLGDFCVSGKEEHILSSLKGKKHLVKGNHDFKSNEEYRQAGFCEVYDHPIILENFWILSHEALYVNANMPYANLFGHVHNSPIYKNFSPQHYCVCAERIGYAPVPFDKIKSDIQKSTDKK